ncbi:MFS transporter [Megasphaera paucivorans]|uniref:Sugar phosphate permease n=1 Tax=Megasphaera paucivorans TaxID=349095 RepID=A0A1H0AHZ0_9FIRM|nr:MFS transporter [Megasphaera paucivorans]SDN33190.1 Sugar phosphate permease [Megasphaera paucivorans]
MNNVAENLEEKDCISRKFDNPLEVSQKEQPTKKRFIVLFVICLIYLITYLDRVNISIAAPFMMEEFGLNKMQWGIVLSVFSWTYAISQVPVGMLCDKFGARKTLSIIVTWWSVFTVATSWVWNTASLVIVRLMFGLGEGGAFPSATRALAHWIPATERGFAQGLTHGFSRFGGAVTPMIAAFIMSLWGWRSCFEIFSVIGLIWAGVWWFWFRDTPEEYKEKWGGINQIEIDKIQGAKDTIVKSKPKLKFKQLLKSKNAWFLCLSYPTYCYTVWIFMTWLPSYLVEARGFDLLHMGFFASIPLLAGTVGDTLGGIISDKIWKKTGNGKLARRIVPMSGMCIAAAFMIPGALTESAYMAVFFMACSLFGLEMAVGVYWATCLDIGNDYAGTISGFMNTIGNIGSALSPLVFGAVLQITGSWIYPFMVASSILVIGALLWLKVNPEMKIADELNLE